MLRIYVSVFILFCFMPVFPAEKIIISVPRTLSSVPVLELNGKTIAGYETEVQFYDDHILAMSEFVSGRISIFMTGFSQGLSYYNSSKNISLVANPVWGMSSLVTANPSLRKISDFKGKKILVPFAGSPLDVQLRAIIRAQHLDGQITIEYSPVQQQIPLIVAGRADGGCVPEPLASQFIISKKGFRVFSFQQGWGDMTHGEARTPQVSLFSRTNFVRSHKGYCSALIDAVRLNSITIVSQKKSFAKKYSSVFHLDEKVLSESFDHVLFEIADAAVEKKLIRDYQKLIGDTVVIGNDFFRDDR